MEQVYRKECWSTLIAFCVVTLLTHIFPLYFLFPELTQMMLFGYPAHYLITIVAGWIVLIPVYWVYIRISDNIEREIEETSQSALDRNEADAISVGSTAE